MKRKAKPKKSAPKKVQPIPEDYNVVIPYLAIRGAAQAIEFYKKVFGAKEIMRMPGPGGKIGHAEVKIGDCKVMLSDEFEEMQMLGPQTRGGTSVMIHLYVKDVDATAAKAAQAGGTIVRPVADQFYGDRTCLVEDPFGHRWYIATHTVDLSKAELKKRAAAMAAGG
jgi:PhnB protein